MTQMLENGVKIWYQNKTFMVQKKWFKTAAEVFNLIWFIVA